MASFRGHGVTASDSITWRAIGRSSETGLPSNQVRKQRHEQPHEQHEQLQEQVVPS